MVYLCFGAILSVRQTFGSKPNCQRGTVSTLEFRFEAKLSTWISTLESFCRELIFCSLFYAKMVVSRFIIEFWRTGVSVDNRKFCPIFVAKSAPKGFCRKPLFCSLFPPKVSHFYSKMIASRCIFVKLSFGAILSFSV